jgi:hypothetical protein
MDAKTRHSMLLKVNRMIAELPVTSLKRDKLKLIRLALSYSASLPTVNRVISRRPGRGHYPTP